MINSIKYALEASHIFKRSANTSIIFTFTSKRRVRELNEVKISISDDLIKQTVKVNEINYVQTLKQIKDMNWENLTFDKLCSLPQKTIQFINMDIKKDKFNIPDVQFYNFSSLMMPKSQANDDNVQRLNKFYKRQYFLINNCHKEYDEINVVNESKRYYKHEMYIMDLQQNKQLENVISYFINHINFPNSLELVAEPSLIKHLLSTKRELMLQGIYFQSRKDEKIKKKIQKKRIKQAKAGQIEDTNQKDPLQDRQLQEQDEQEDHEFEQQPVLQQSKINAIISESLKELKHTISIKEVLGYQYEFWVDVKHNRNKNGVEEDYIIEEKEIDNPNDSVLVKQKYPKIKIKYLVHKKKRKEYSMHFCIKAHLLVLIDGKHSRKVKVEWRGPSNKTKQNKEDVAFLVIDYQNLMGGNPTIKPIFSF